MLRGWKPEELTRILGRFVEIYRDRGVTTSDLQIQAIPRGITRITFPRDISADLFAYLVNYLHYPHDFDLTSRFITVAGKTILSADFGPPAKEMLGRNAVFYVPADDQEHDLVFVRVNSATYQISFTDNMWKRVSDERRSSHLDKLLEEVSSLQK